jgi:hypothetical protein
LGNCRGCLDVFRFWNETCSPNPITFLKRLIREVSGFRVRKITRTHFWFILVLVLDVLHEGWEWASPASVYPPSVLSFYVPLFLAFGLTTNAAARKAAGHFDSSGAEVDLWVMLVKPANPKDHALLAKTGDCEENALGVSIVDHDSVDNLADAAGLVRGSVYIVNRNWLRELAGRKLGLSDKVLVYKVSSRTGIHHGFCRCFFHGVCGFEMDRNHDAVGTLLQRADDKFLAHSFFPFGTTGKTGLHGQKRE